MLNAMLSGRGAVFVQRDIQTQHRHRYRCGQNIVHQTIWVGHTASLSPMCRMTTETIAPDRFGPATPNTNDPSPQSTCVWHRWQRSYRYRMRSAPDHSAG
jgi:hypothetical protein